jgi:hypothetical protein
MKVTGITALVFVTWCVFASSAHASTMTGFGNHKFGNERTRAATFANDPDEFFSVYCSDVGRDLTVPDWPKGLSRPISHTLAQVASWTDVDDDDRAPRAWHYLRWHFTHDWKDDWDGWKRVGKRHHFGWRHRLDRVGDDDAIAPAAAPVPEPGSVVLLISGAALGLKRGVRYLRRYSAGVKPV